MLPMNDINHAQSFLEEVLIAAGYTNKEEFPTLIKELEPILEMRIYTKIGERLNEQQKKDIETMVDTGTKEENILAYIQECFDDYPKFLADILEDFKQEYIQAING